MKRIQLYLTDDHLIFLEGLQLLLGRQPGLEIVGHGTNGLHVRQFFNEGGRADVVVLDLRMPYFNGKEVTQFLKQRSPATKIIVLSVSKDPKEIQEMISMEVDGYLLKDNGGDELVKAIEKVMSGRKYFGKDVLSAIEHQARPVRNELPSFTKKEVEVLALIVEGYTTPMIAEALCIKPSTVETHCKSLLGKTGLHNRQAMVRFALENGLTKKSLTSPD